MDTKDQLIKKLKKLIKHSQHYHHCASCRAYENEIVALDKQVKEQESKRLTDAEITAKAKLYAGNAIDKGLMEHDYCAGAVMAREFYTGVIQDLGENQLKPNNQWT